MRVGVALPHYSFSLGSRELNWPDMVAVARTVEEAGFETAWISDHYFMDISRYGGPGGPQQCYDPLAAVAGLAVETSNLILGTLVLAVGFRPPGVLAKTAASLDALSGGRFELGLGAGWNEPEYRAAGLPFPSAGTRLDQLEEAVRVVRGMTSGAGRFSHEGEHFRINDAPNVPPPARTPLPIWVGAKGDRALRVVARAADGWNVVWRWTPETYRERVAELERACQEVDRDPAEIRRSVGLITLVGESRSDLARRFQRWRDLAPKGTLDVDLDDFAVDRLVGTPEDVLERAVAFRELGADELVLNLGPLPFSWFEESGLELLDDVLVELRSWTPLH